MAPPIQGGTKNSSYGYGTVYEVTPAGVEHVVHKFAGSPNDGQYPRARLVVVSGKLYGTTAGGGAYGAGTVYAITTSGDERVVYSFKGGSAAAGPTPALSPSTVRCTAQHHPADNTTKEQFTR